MQRLTFGLIILILFLTNFSRADEGDYEGFAVAAGASVTQGLGIDIGYELTNKTRLRLGMYAWNYERTEAVNDIRYKADLKMVHPGIYLDYRPFSEQKEGLRLTTGLIFNSNNWKATATPINNTFTINKVVYNASTVGNLKSKVKFNDFAPYLGIGYDWRINGNWSLTSDLGATYQGSPQVSLTADGPISTNPMFQAILRQEERNIHEEINNDVKLWPVLKITLEYRF